MEKKLRVWWIPQVPGKPFHISVSSVEEAAKIMVVLADYDAFQYKHRIKPDYSNAGGLEEFVNGEWQDWESEDGEGDPVEFVKSRTTVLSRV